MKTMTLLFALALAGALPAADKKTPPENSYDLHWGDLAELITGRTASLVLPSGQKIKGKVLEVEPEALVLQVRKNKTSVPRASVSQLRVTKVHGHTWRVVGTAIGLGAALVPAAIVGYFSPPAGIALFAGGGGLGFWGGREADRKTMLITVH